MTNLDQHSALYGTQFGVMGSLEGLFQTAPSPEMVTLGECDRISNSTARRMRRRNRQMRMH